MPAQSLLNSKWIEIAQVASTLSKDPKTKVGAVIVSPNNRQFSLGYNGFAVGVEETPEKWERPTKYDYVIHAELNAVLNCPFQKEGCSIFITHQPCHICLNILLNSQIKTVYYMHDYILKPEHLRVWNDAAIKFDRIEKIIL
jgi:dCMP deaminase